MSVKKKGRAGVARPLTLMVLGLWLVLPAEGQWQKKPFQEWTREEARKVLRKSPWGKSHLFVIPSGDGYERDLRSERAAWPGLDPQGPPDPTRSGDIEQRLSSRSDNPLDDPRNSISQGESRGSGESGGQRRAAERYRVFWYSSLRARQAIGRLRQLRGLDLKEQMQALHGQSRRHHIIAVTGRVSRFYRRATLEEIRGKTFLLSGKRKPKKIDPVQFVGPETLRFPMALFLFPRVTEAGRTLELRDGEARFISQQGPLKVKTSFKLKKMMTDGKLDL